MATKNYAINENVTFTLQQRIDILKFTTKMHENQPEFYRKIIMSDEAHFHLGGYITKHSGLRKPKNDY